MSALAVAHAQEIGVEPGDLFIVPEGRWVANLAAIGFHAKCGSFKLFCANGIANQE